MSVYDSIREGIAEDFRKARKYNETVEKVKEARRLIGFMTNDKIAEAARILDEVIS